MEFASNFHVWHCKNSGNILIPRQPDAVYTNRKICIPCILAQSKARISGINLLADGGLIQITDINNLENGPDKTGNNYLC